MIDLGEMARRLAADYCGGGHVEANCPIRLSLLANLQDVDRLGWKRGMEEAAEIAARTYPCSCDAAYTDRKLSAPDCFHCVPLAEAAEQIRSRAQAKVEEEQ